jgi:ornithine cyclodeaminase
VSEPQSVLALSRADVEALIDPDALLDALAAALTELSRGEVSMPPRVAATVDASDGWLGGMLAYVPSAGVIAAKLVSLYPGNARLGRDTHHALVACFDPATGVPLAIMEGASITAARTAGASALSVRLLAREDARTLAILGTGVQAAAHARAVGRLRAWSEIRVWGRDPARAAALAERIGANARAVPELDEALDGADVVCAATHADEPVVVRERLSIGTHVTSVGYNRAGREVDGATIRDAHVVLESRDAALAPYPAGSNDIAMAIAEGIVPRDKAFVEIGEILDSRAAGRTERDEITLYKSVGVAAEDAAAAGLVLRAARRQGAGQRIEL